MDRDRLECNPFVTSTLAERWLFLASGQGEDLVVGDLNVIAGALSPICRSWDQCPFEVGTAEGTDDSELEAIARRLDDQAIHGVCELESDEVRFVEAVYIRVDGMQVCIDFNLDDFTRRDAHALRTDQAQAPDGVGFTQIVPLSVRGVHGDEKIQILLDVVGEIDQLSAGDIASMAINIWEG